ncbi:MAG: sulfotransferase, partial [Candidatus Krumholzibacteriia bacterium]
MTADGSSGAAGPVVIIGAARSGTKILRSMLAAHPSLSAVPFDINYVWMARHQGRRDDELVAADATPAACRFIREYLGNFAAPGTRVVEKTVGNTLRVPFVDRVFPDAVYIHLVRDGRDVAASARVQWRKP